jgi:hypothetical protein
LRLSLKQCLQADVTLRILRPNALASRRWKYEEPLKLELESETDLEVGFSAPLFSFSLKELHLKLRRPKSDEEKRRIAERRVVQEREHEASRPYH